MRFLIVFVFLITYNLYGQKESYNWFFGVHAAITFDTPNGEPELLEHSRLNSLEGVSAISDTSGNLLFYTDGVYVWNALHERMNKDTLLLGHYSSTQSALIVKLPGINSLYYIFTADAGEYVDMIDSIKAENRGLCYTIVDASLNNGLGEIIAYNIPVHLPVAEKLTATIHRNNHDVWLISHEWGSDRFISVLLTEDGVSDIIFTAIGSTYYGSPIRAIGHLKASPCRTKVVSVINELDYLELFSFDNETGKVYDLIRVFTPNRFNNYGVEFSPDGNLLYVSETSTRTIYQYNTSVMTSESVNVSGRFVTKGFLSYAPGALQLSPNGKIYVAFMNAPFLGSIENPNEYGDNCIFTPESIYLNKYNRNARCQYGLPNMSQGYFFMSTKLTDTTVCSGTDFALDPQTNVYFNDMRFEWKGPASFYSNNYLLQIHDFAPQNVGKYYFKAFFRDYVISDSIEISISITPVAEISGDSVICSDAPIILSSKYESAHYEWSTGDTTRNTYATEPGTYILKIYNDFGCLDYDTLHIKAEKAIFQFDNPTIGHFGDLCIGEELTIKTGFRNITGMDIIVKRFDLVKSSQQIQAENKINILIRDGDYMEFTFKIKSNEVVIIDDTLNFVISDFCEIVEKLPIYGRIIAPNTFMIPEIRGGPGTELCIPVYAKINCPGANYNNASYSVELSFDSDYFMPYSSTKATIIYNDVIDFTRFIEFSDNNLTLSDNYHEITKICGKLLVGTEKIEPIALKNAEWHSDLFMSDYEYGSFRISSCALEVRPINYYKPAKLAVISPANETVAKLKIQGTTEGEYEIAIYNTLGYRIATYIFINPTKNIFEKEFILDTSLLSTGIYYATLKSPWLFDSVKFIVIK